MIVAETYRVVARREDDWWLLTVPALDEATTQVRRLDRAEATARDLIATWLDVAPDSFGVELYVPGLSDHVSEVRQRWEAVRAAEAEGDLRPVVRNRPEQKELMLRMTLAVALTLAALGVAFYAGTGAASPTALIPTAIGALLLGCWALARAPRWRRHGMHAALAVALLGALGSLMNVVKLPELIAGTAARPSAVLESTLMFLLLVGYLILGVRSFISARRQPTAER